MKFLAVLALCFSSVALSATITCGAGNKCPESTPCCNQYGLCGVGLACLGGCDVRYSYNISACMPMPMMSSFLTTFDESDVLLDQDTYLGNSLESDWIYSGHVATHDNATLMQMPQYSGGTVISSTKYLWYGKVKTTLKTSHGAGVVTACILFSNVQDEIDFEFVGSDLTEAQNNYYSLGALNYSNADKSELSDTFANYHTYEIDWRNDLIEWFIDGTSVRTLNRSETWNKTANRYEFPQTPARIQFSLWPGGNSTNAKGTIEWAGGEIDWDSSDIKNNGYYYAYVKNITVEQYDLPSGLKKLGNLTGKYVNYIYNSTSGSQDDIFLTDKLAWLGNDEATGFDPDNDTSKSSSSSSSSSSSGSASKTSTKKSTGTATGTATSGSDSDSGDSGDDSTLSYTNAGFMQNDQTGTASATSTANTAKNDANMVRQGYAGVVGAGLLGMGSFLL